MTNRYETSHIVEGQFQEHSNESVLKNKLGIVDSNEIDEIELALLVQLTDFVVNNVTLDQRLTASDLSEWHRRWLGNLYDWAGRYRSVNLGKADFHFAAAHLIPNLMNTFEKKFLSVYMPCRAWKIKH